MQKKVQSWSKPVLLDVLTNRGRIKSDNSIIHNIQPGLKKSHTSPAESQPGWGRGLTTSSVSNRVKT